MVRSPGFGSTPYDLYRPIQARFHCGSVIWLNLAVKSNSLDRSTKSTPSPDKPAPTPCRHTVSGSISLPSRGSFHLSITVLVHYRSYIMFSLGWWSSRIQPGFLVSRPTRENKHKVNVAFVYAAITLYRGTFQFLLLATSIFYLIRSLIGVDRKSDCSNRGLNSLTWSFVNSQHPTNIRLSPYLYLRREVN